MKESNIQRAVMLAASESGMTVWRNNVAMAWTGKATRRKDGSVLIENPRPLHAGLCKGSSDLIGLQPVTVTEAMVGETLAVFTALEIKTARGKVSPEQERFLEFVKSKGGIARVARSAADVAAITTDLFNAKQHRAKLAPNRPESGT